MSIFAELKSKLWSEHTPVHRLKPFRRNAHTQKHIHAVYIYIYIYIYIYTLYFLPLVQFHNFSGFSMLKKKVSVIRTQIQLNALSFFFHVIRKQVFICTQVKTQKVIFENLKRICLQIQQQCFTFLFFFFSPFFEEA